MIKHNPSTYNLNKLSIISLDGQDAKEFIQGQITNDINLVSNKQSIYAGYCSPKGRLIAFFHIVKFQESFLLLCPSSISTEISKKLSMYVLRAKVIIKLNPEYLTFFGVSLNKENKNTNNLFSNPPKSPMNTVFHDEISITKLPGQDERLLIIGLSKKCNSLLKGLQPNSNNLNNKDWFSDDIRTKIPNIFLETQNQFIPQSLNLDLINAINFKKGCYTGQEIVARTHYLGQPKRRMYLGSVHLDKEPKFGETIIADEENVGQVVNVYCKEKGLYCVLLELQIKKINSELKLLNSKINITDNEKLLFKNDSKQ